MRCAALTVRPTAAAACSAGSYVTGMCQLVGSCMLHSQLLSTTYAAVNPTRVTCMLVCFSAVSDQLFMSAACKSCVDCSTRASKHCQHEPAGSDQACWQEYQLLCRLSQSQAFFLQHQALESL